MDISSFLIRSADTQDELREHVNRYVEVAQSFSPELLPEDLASRLIQKIITLPGYRQEQVRSAYRSGEHLGGYRIHERILRVGVARLTIGCIGGVYTRAEARNEGVATALMQDAIAYAQAHEYSLVLLDGIPKFYHRYGYCDVYDLSTLELDRQAVLALSKSSYTVRLARLSDAASLLLLYEHQFGPYTGSFERSIEWQIHWMQHLEMEKLLVAIDPADQVRGYLFLAGTQTQGHFFLAGTEVWELAVDDWSATVALLQYHARLAKGKIGHKALYNVPPNSVLVDLLVENLEVVDISTWDMPILGWAVREQTFRHRDAGWMAHLVNLPALTRAMLPEWQDHWRSSLGNFSGEVSLIVGDEGFTLRIEGSDLQLMEMVSRTTNVFQLTPQTFTQIVFGFCAIGRVLQRYGYTLDGDLAMVLMILFPIGQTWIAASDWF